LNVYSHVSGNLQKEAAAKLAALVYRGYRMSVTRAADPISVPRSITAVSGSPETTDLRSRCRGNSGIVWCPRTVLNELHRRTVASRRDAGGHLARLGSFATRGPVTVRHTCPRRGPSRSPVTADTYS
jgi:hypothetical protein